MTLGKVADEQTIVKHRGHGTRKRRPAKSALQALEKTKYQRKFEKLYGEDAPKPSGTDWITTQYREDSDGRLWVWKGEMNGNRKIFEQTFAIPTED